MCHWCRGCKLRPRCWTLRIVLCSKRLLYCGSFVIHFITVWFVWLVTYFTKLQHPRDYSVLRGSQNFCFWGLSATEERFLHIPPSLPSGLCSDLFLHLWCATKEWMDEYLLMYKTQVIIPKKKSSTQWKMSMTKLIYKMLRGADANTALHNSHQMSQIFREWILDVRHRNWCQIWPLEPGGIGTWHISPHFGPVAECGTWLRSTSSYIWGNSRESTAQK